MSRAKGRTVRLAVSRSILKTGLFEVFEQAFEMIIPNSLSKIKDKM